MPATQWIPNQECKAQSGLLKEAGLIQATVPGTTFDSIKKAVPFQQFAGLDTAALKIIQGRKQQPSTRCFGRAPMHVRNTGHPKSPDGPAPLGGHTHFWAEEREIKKPAGCQNTQHTVGKRERRHVSPCQSSHLLHHVRPRSKDQLIKLFFH